MGIDPNNHRLTHKFPPLQNPTTSGSSTSSGLKDNRNIIAKNIHNNEPTIKPEIGLSDLNHEQVSDAASGLEDESYGGVPDLNLDLTMSIPSTSSSPIIIPTSAANGDTQKPIHHESKSSREMHFANSSPTLFLFQ